MNFRFLKPAQIELEEAADRYDKGRMGLGFEFACEVDAAIERILADPTSYEKVDDSIFTIRTKRFPYAIYYAVDEHEKAVIIISVMHLSRKPDYWKDRI